MRPSLLIFDKSLFKNARFYILVLAFLASVGIWLGVGYFLDDPTLARIRLEEIYGFTGLGLLYGAVLITPLSGTFPNLRLNPWLLHARRALGVSAFYFSLLHVLLTFFGQLGGFSGLRYLGGHYLVALWLGAVALFILFLMAVTSLDYAVWRLTFPRWKFLHRFVYLAIICIIIHLILISSHVNGILAPATQVLVLTAIALGCLEAMRLDRKHPDPTMNVGRLGAYTWGFSLIVILFLLLVVTLSALGLA